jgi:hypothetical protein
MSTPEALLLLQAGAAHEVLIDGGCRFAAF